MPNLSATALSMLVGLLAGCLGGQAPPQLSATFEPGVVRGADRFVRRRVLLAPDIGGVTDIAFRKPSPLETESVIVAGTAGVVFLEPGDYGMRRLIRLNDGKPPFLTHRILDADGDGGVEFFRQPRSTGDPALYDGRGFLLWQGKSPGGFPWATFGDLDGDRKLEFLAGSSYKPAVRLYDHEGRIRFDQEWDRHMHWMRIEDQDGDHKGEFRYWTAGKAYRRDAKGGLISSEPMTDINEREKRFGKGELRFKPEAAGVVLAVRQRELAQQALPAGYSATRLKIEILDPAGAVLYEEIVKSAHGDVARGHGAIAVVPIRDSSGEALLVGYGPEVYEYTLRSP